MISDVIFPRNTLALNMCEYLGIDPATVEEGSLTITPLGDKAAIRLTTVAVIDRETLAEIMLTRHVTNDRQ